MGILSHPSSGLPHPHPRKVNCRSVLKHHPTAKKVIYSHNSSELSLAGWGQTRELALEGWMSLKATWLLQLPTTST